MLGSVLSQWGRRWSSGRASCGDTDQILCSVQLCVAQTGQIKTCCSLWSELQGGRRILGKTKKENERFVCVIKNQENMCFKCCKSTF